MLPEPRCNSLGGLRGRQTLQVMALRLGVSLCTIVLGLGSIAGQSKPLVTAGQSTPSKSPAPAQGGATMLVQSDLDCTFAIDDQPKQPLKAGDTVRISATSGQHLVTAVSADGKDRWKTVVDVDKPAQKVVLIELVKVRAARQAAERQVLQLQQDIAAKEEQGKEDRQKTQALEQQRAAVTTKQREIDDEIAALQKRARHEDASQADAHFRRGEVFRVQEKWDEAMFEYQEALRIRPDNAEAHSALGLALIIKGRPKEAVAEEQQAIRLKPDYAYAHTNLGCALANQGDWNSAIDEFREAVRLDASIAGFHDNLGAALEHEGSLQQALEQYDRARKLDPRSAKYKANYNRVSKRLKARS